MTEEDCNITFRIQHPWDVEVFFCNVEGQIEIFQWIVLEVEVELERSSYYQDFQLRSETYFGELGVVQEVRAVTMDESAECQSWRENGIKTGGVVAPLVKLTTGTTGT